jgi:hypothetical protein
MIAHKTQGDFRDKLKHDLGTRGERCIFMRKRGLAEEWSHRARKMRGFAGTGDDVYSITSRRKAQWGPILSASHMPSLLAASSCRACHKL